MIKLNGKMWHFTEGKVQIRAKFRKPTLAQTASGGGVEHTKRTRVEVRRARSIILKTRHQLGLRPTDPRPSRSQERNLVRTFILSFTTRH